MMSGKQSLYFRNWVIYANECRKNGFYSKQKYLNGVIRDKLINQSRTRADFEEFKTKNEANIADMQQQSALLGDRWGKTI